LSTTAALSKRGSHHDFNLLRLLEVFLAIAEHGQMTQAASALGITQSAVSQHLTNLEAFYSTTLVDRALRPMRLTLTGEALRLHASELMHRVNQIDSDLDQIGQWHIPLLRIGLLPQCLSGQFQPGKRYSRLTACGQWRYN
jgi:DNA-binding transcriptional LysR family regulator